ncbi:MAG: ATP-binding protein, partial [Candidatus Sericytochromatia bacterium]
SGEFMQQRLLLERILQNLPAAVAVWDADLVYRMVNPVYGKWFNDMPVDHFIGKHLFQVFPEAEGALKDMLHHVLETGEVCRETSFSFGFEQGGVRHGTLWDFELHPLRNELGEIDGVLALAFEVSERVKMEQALEKKSQLIESIIDHMPALVGSLDHGGRVRWLNDSGMRLFELGGELPAELALRTLFPGLAGEEGRLGPLLEAGLPGNHPAMLAASPHQPHAYFDLVFLPMRQSDDGEADVLLFGFDVSARVENERLVRERVQALEAASVLKDEFIATVSHELRTPLTVIGNVGSILAKGRAGLLNGKQTELTGLMQTQIKRLNSLIDDLLDFQRLESGSITFHTVHVDVCSLLEEIAMSFASVVEEKAIAFQVALPSRDLHARLDPHRFTQAMLNLLSNAVKFTPRGGAITLSAERRGAEVWVSVRDTGIGIHAADQQRIFERFTQVDSGLIRQHGGSGLGLAITQRLVEKAANGRIWVESEPGVGSIFRIALPLHPAAEVAS